MNVTLGEDEAYPSIGDGEVAQSREIVPGVLLDLTANGEAVGLELLGLRRPGLHRGQVAVRLAATEAGHEADERRLADLLRRGAPQALKPGASEIDGSLAPVHPTRRPGFCRPRSPISMGSLRSSAPDHRLGHLAAKSPAAVGSTRRAGRRWAG